MKFTLPLLLLVLALVRTTFTAPVESVGLTVLERRSPDNKGQDKNKKPKHCTPGYQGKNFKGPKWNLTEEERHKLNVVNSCDFDTKNQSRQAARDGLYYEFADVREKGADRELYKDSKDYNKAKSDKDKARLKKEIQQDKNDAATWSVRRQAYGEKLVADHHHHPNGTHHPHHPGKPGGGGKGGNGGKK